MKKERERIGDLCEEALLVGHGLLVIVVVDLFGLRGFMSLILAFHLLGT